MSEIIEKEVLNLTPHNIKVELSDDESLVYPASGSIARVSQTSIDLRKSIDGIPVYRSEFGDVQMPPPKDGIIYLVSGLVFAALNGSRTDVIAPKTDNTAIRDERGQIIAITGFLGV